MATVYFFISSGAAPFTASIDPAVVSDLTNLATGQHYFTNVPDGSYTVLVTDALGCESSFPVDIACSTTTTTVCEDCTTTTTTECEECTTTTTTECEGCTTTTTTVEITTTTTTCYLEYFIWETPCSLVTTTTTTAYEPCGYGLLYNWYAATDARKITSSDNWNVPDKQDFEDLIVYLGGELLDEYTAYLADAKSLADSGSSYWTLGVGTDVYNFKMRGSGVIDNDGLFHEKNTSAYYGVSDDTGLEYTGFIWGHETGVNLFEFYTEVTNGSMYKTAGVSLRLIYNSSVNPGIYTGNDGKTYSTCKIGNQVWLAENLIETKYRNGNSIPEVTDPLVWSALTTGALCAYDNDWSNACLDEPTTTTTTVTP